jgi:hypothetical protein
MGKSYPGSTVVLLKDGQSVATTIANAEGVFQTTLSGISGGNYIFGAHALDTKGVQSPLIGFPVSVASGAVLKVSGISIAPSLYLTNTAVKKKEALVLSGSAIPGTALYAIVDKNNGVNLNVQVGKKW